MDLLYKLTISNKFIYSVYKFNALNPLSISQPQLPYS